MSQWNDVLPASVKQKMTVLFRRTNEERKYYIVYPPQDKVFAALETVSPDAVKVVILGQDPYHEYGQANGLSFSVNDGVVLPPSLKNIFKELEGDLGVKRSSGDLSDWAKQGVLLLNTVLTVRDGAANSHKDYGWQEVTSAIIRYCIENTNCVFIAWGMQAKNVIMSASAIHPTDRMIVSTHPSPFSALKSYPSAEAFIGSRPFSKANEMLKQIGQAPIQW